MDGSTLYADLRGTDLSKTQGLTVKQIQAALIGTDLKTNESLLSVEDLKDPDELIGFLRDKQDPVSHYLREQFSPAFREQLKESDPYIGGSQPLQQPLVDELNLLIKVKSLYEKARFEKVKLGPNTQLQLQEMQRQQQDNQNVPPELRQLMNPMPDPMPNKRLIRLNRLLLADLYPGHIVSDPETKLPSYLRMTAAQIEAATSESGVRAADMVHRETERQRENERQKALGRAYLGPM